VPAQAKKDALKCCISTFQFAVLVQDMGTDDILSALTHQLERQQGQWSRVTLTSHLSEPERSFDQVHTFGGMVTLRSTPCKQ